MLFCILYDPRNLSTVFFFFSSRGRHTSLTCDWSSDVCSSDLSPETTGPCWSFGFLRGSGWVPNGGRGLRSWPSFGRPRRGGELGVHFTPPLGSAASWHRVSGCW